MAQALVIGAGPAGLMAAEQLVNSGHQVVVAEAKPSVARKFLMAGKSGLNLTKNEPFDLLMGAYGDAVDWLRPMIREFDAEAIMRWAEDLGQEMFTGSTGRVFPKVMKASPLLRVWLARLSQAGVEIRTRWKWQGWRDEALIFDTPSGEHRLNPDVTVLALGGASWARLGSDGAWASWLTGKGVQLQPFSPANAALSVHWSDHMRPYFGAPLKSVRWTAGELVSRGEATISERGLEGGGMYTLTPALRSRVPLHLDLAPDMPAEDLQARFQAKKAKATLSHWLRNNLRLPPQKIGLLYEMTKISPPLKSDWIAALKHLPIHHAGLRPMDEAISTAGGVPQSALDGDLMLIAMPGVFCAGEMLDWEAPTGGYLLTGCLATGRWAGQSAAAWLATNC